MTRYRYTALMPIGSAGAQSHNEAILGQRTLGIEVTEQLLAARCRLGNIDPQHDGSGSSLAAIDAALGWPLPPDGATLATIRPDLDSLGAMAVLSVRATGRQVNAAMRRRVEELSAIDRFDEGSWPGPRAWPVSPENLIEDVGGGATGVLATAVRDRAKPIVERVDIVRTWLEEGLLPESVENASEKRANVLWNALKNGEIKISEAAAPGQVVEIETTVNGVLRLGYRLAPVVVALNPRFEFPDGSVGRKYTVAQYGEGYLDLKGTLAKLSRREPGWGGSHTIVGSPQGHESQLACEEVTATVLDNITKEMPPCQRPRKAS